MTNFLRLPRLALTIALVGAAVALLATSAAFGASTPSAPAGGSIQIFSFSTSPDGGSGSILITGAIGDHGRTLSTNESGNPDPNGDYVKVTLTKGTFEINATKLVAKANHASPTFSQASCSAALSVTSPVTLLNGTGLYKGITGTVHVTASDAFILPRLTSGTNTGQCNESNSAQPVASLQLVDGTGTVRFG